MTHSDKAQKGFIVTIDGPAGAGKTTVSKTLAARLGYRYIDTGALYRGVALAVQRAGVAEYDDTALSTVCRAVTLDFIFLNDDLRLTLDGEDVSDLIRTPEISMLASAVSARPLVREYLMEIQRTLGRAGSAVLEGRDMGTVVFPDADIKFFLSADTPTRARRRYDELIAKQDCDVELAEVERDIIQRDRNDSTRDIAPLKPAADAIQIDSSRMTVAEVVDAMLAHIGQPDR